MVLQGRGVGVGEEQEEAAEIGWGEMKYLESPAKHLGLGDTTTFEQGCDMVIRVVWRPSRYSMEGFMRGRHNESITVLWACWERR